MNLSQLSLETASYTERMGKGKEYRVLEVVDLVTKSKGSKNVLTELLLPETLENVFQSIRVPDWVLLFFKLQTRLPDSAWQTLLNLTRLGKSGVNC